MKPLSVVFLLIGKTCHRRYGVPIAHGKCSNIKIYKLYDLKFHKVRDEFPLIVIFDLDAVDYDIAVISRIRKLSVVVNNSES